MINTLYFSHEIRGREGEDASEHLQKHNLNLACQKVTELRKHFTEIEFICPHEHEMINDMVFCGALDSDDLVEAECWYINKCDKVDGVVVVGKCSPGCGKEVVAAHEAHKFVCFIEDVSMASMEYLAEELARWERE
jgi:hypothetical protein